MHADRDRAATRPILCPAIHAEALHQPRVAAMLRDAITQSGLRFTVFVESLHARILGVDISSHLDWLAASGHEIALHTHHYRLYGEHAGNLSFEKRIGSDLEPQHLRRGLDEGLGYLVERGHRPVGFVAGSWLLLEPVLPWLTANGLVYDCSLRSRHPPHASSTVARGVLSDAVHRRGAVIEVPTTASLAEQVRGTLPFASSTARVGDDRYELFYLHDYDLLDWRKRAALRALGILNRRAPVLTVHELVQRQETIAFH